MMITRMTALACVAALGLTACENPNTVNTVGTAAVGAGLATIAATALGAGAGWNIAAATAGATAGALYARNHRTNDCAYHTGDGENVYVQKCP
jgi:osmotically inducible lipoprotein OsmB